MINKKYEYHQSIRNTKLENYPKLVAAIKRNLDPDDLEVQSLELWTIATGEDIYFYETPGHGYFFSLEGFYLGEEDDGLIAHGWELLKDATKKVLI